MRLRRWCVSQVSEPLQFFWTLRGAEAEYWERYKRSATHDRMGLYRWDGSKWRKQVRTLVNGGMEKHWLDEATA